jgi:thiol-disulfide isomerase/thioredoxin
LLNRFKQVNVQIHVAHIALLLLLQACKAVAPLFYRLAGQHRDIVFVDVPVTQDNAVIHQGLGVPSLPFGHVYHPSQGLVEELKLTRKDFHEFEHALAEVYSNFQSER